MFVIWFESRKPLAIEPPAPKPRLSDFVVSSGEDEFVDHEGEGDQQADHSRKRTKRSVPPLVQNLERTLNPVKEDNLHKRARKKTKKLPSLVDYSSGEESENAGITSKTTSVLSSGN